MCSCQRRVIRRLPLLPWKRWGGRAEGEVYATSSSGKMEPGLTKSPVEAGDQGACSSADPSSFVPSQDGPRSSVPFAGPQLDLEAALKMEHTLRWFSSSQRKNFNIPATTIQAVAGMPRRSCYGHLEQSLLACGDWPARSVTGRDFTPGGEGDG